MTVIMTVDLSYFKSSQNNPEVVRFLGQEAEPSSLATWVPEVESTLSHWHASVECANA